MSWMIKKAGRASKIGAMIKDAFEKAGGAPAGSAEEAAKNAIGGAVEVLAKSLSNDPVIIIEASGSAWHIDGSPRSHHVTFKFETLGDFVE